MRGTHAMGIVTYLEPSATDTAIIFNISMIFSLPTVHTYLNVLSQ